MPDPASPRKVFFYIDYIGREPFVEWLNSLRDPKGRRCIVRRMHRLKEGIYGDHKPLGEGVSELRIFSGPGYRVYLGEHENTIIVLLGGDKDSQNNDIQRAKALWKEYKNLKKL